MSLSDFNAADKRGSFELAPKNIEQADAIIAKYPAGRQQSAVLPVLDLCQRQNAGWLSQDVIEYVARLLEMPFIRVHEVATFYTMFKLKPVGRYQVQVCTTTPCWLMGSDDVVTVCKRILGVELGETTSDGQFTLTEVECLGACVNGPMMQINDDYYEDLDAQSTTSVLQALQRGETPAAGSQTGRQASCAIGGPTTLEDLEAPKRP